MKKWLRIAKISVVLIFKIVDVEIWRGGANVLLNTYIYPKTLFTSFCVQKNIITSLQI